MNFFESKFKTNLFLINLIYVLVQLELIQMISTAYCAPPEPKSVLNSGNIVDYVNAGVVLTGSMYVLRTFPPQFRVLAGLSIVSTVAVSQITKSVITQRFEQKAISSNNNGGFKANSIIENDFTEYFKYEYFVFLSCFLLIIFALIVFTIIVTWVIVHKYNSWVLFLHKKIKSRFFFIFIEKIKKISRVQILYFVAVFYINLFLCVYLLLNFF